ncbi:MAG TPA: amidohydrolase family protein [Thermoleophilia bacterium]|nr:amidohydrolase family protein [Thermoleophilia bacterium]
MECIDFRVRLRTEEMLRPWNPEHPAPHFSQYIELYKMKDRLTPMGMPEFVEHMVAGGVQKGVVCGGSVDDNDHLLDIKASPQGGSFYYIAGVHPDYGIRRNLEELDRCRQAGFLGVNISPYIWGVPANANLLFPLYAYCEQHGMVAIVHGSLHYNRFQSMWLGDPQYMDEIAINFPDLKLVVSHAGNGFGTLALAVAQKHPNIFLEFSALWPKYLPDATIQAVNSYLSDRCLFGTDYPLVEFEQGREAWNEALKPKVKELFFARNAERCLFEGPR